MKSKTVEEFYRAEADKFAEANDPKFDDILVDDLDRILDMNIPNDVSVYREGNSNDKSAAKTRAEAIAKAQKNERGNSCCFKC